MITARGLQLGTNHICGRARKLPDEVSLGVVPQSRWRHIKGVARQRKKQFDLTLIDVERLFQRQGGKCALSGMDICFSKIPRATTASLDRIDSTKGYYLENVQWVHVTINTMKMDIPQELFILVCKAIAARHS